MEYSTNPKPATTFDSVIRLAAEVSPADYANVITIGAVLDDCYELRERIGSGGMALVYRAYDRRLHREVAVKIPKLAQRERARVVDMFEREARATACLNHPNIVSLHHIGDHGGTPFVVLELLSGETLAERLTRRHTLSVAEANSIIEGVLRALSYAHDRGFIHRDLSPRNVFLTHDERVKLLDFGVAVDFDASPGTVTRSGGTPGYMPPEHQATPDPRGDLWAASVLYIECITGKRPSARPAAAELPAELPPEVRAIVARALDHNPARRPSTASEMTAVICNRSGRGRGRRSRWRRRLPLLAAAALVVAGAAVAVPLRPASDPALAAPLVPNDGRWRGDPAADSPWTTTLRRIDANHFAYENHNQLTGRATEGVLLLEKISDGTTLLSGKIKDVPNCETCNKVGFIEMIVLDETHLYQNRSAWGYSHADYVEWYPVYRYKWLGPLRDTVKP
jgi:Protein kinase domain